MDVVCPVRAPAGGVGRAHRLRPHGSFLSNLEYSGVEDTAGNVLRVRQKGKATRGPLTLTFDIVREMELLPYSEIRSRLISGDLKASDFVTRIVGRDGRPHRQQRPLHAEHVGSAVDRTGA